MTQGHENFFHRVIFIVTFEYELRFDKNFCNLTRERQFVQFWHFREDLSDHSQTVPKYRGRHLYQKSRKKIGNIYGHLDFRPFQ